MQRNGRNARAYSSERQLVRVRPHDGRTAGKKRNSAGRKTAVMIAVTFFLVFLSVSAVRDALNSGQGAEDGVRTAGASLGEGGEQKPESDSGTEIIPVSEDNDSPRFLAVIDPGHGGIDNGSNIDGIYEQEINLEIAKRLADKLRERGIDTLLLREDNDTSLGLEERVAAAEKAEADIYISIHQNFYDGADKSVSGLETWYWDGIEGSERLARLVHEGAVGKVEVQDRGLIEGNDLYVVRETSMPSCLIETGFLSNREEREALLTADYQDRLAEGMAEGIYAYFYQ